MSHDVSFRRKIIYIAIIAMLLYPLFRIGQPAGRSGGGGVLAQLREQEGLSQSNLGEIDPASESMKLATLGLRGLAANILWSKANLYHKKEDWDKLSATLNQITKLQPNFISVWEFQSHNLSYNISREFDDYRHRYHWVKKGIDFLVEGTHYNRDNPRILHSVGWFTGQKFGRADEHLQFRVLFRDDDEFHKDLFVELPDELPLDEASGYDGHPDNWLVGRLWYLWAQQAVEGGQPLKGKSPLIFHSDMAMSRINYSSTIEEEGILGEKAQRAWIRAEEDWEQYGRRPIPTSWGHNVRLGDLGQVREDIDELAKKLKKLAPGVREQIYQERRAQLTEAERTAHDMPTEELTTENYEDYYSAMGKTQITNQNVAERAPAENRDAAIKTAARLNEQELFANRIEHYRSIVNYDYWAIRCAAEQTQEAVAARELLFQAEEYDDAFDLDKARKSYEASWVQWRKIFDRYPRLMDDVGADDLAKSIKRYERLLQQLDDKLPEDFPLKDFLQARIEQDASLQEMFEQLDTGPASTEPKQPATDESGTDESATDEPANDEPANDETP